MAIYNIYCDESCHLENDGQPVMVLGAIWCAADVIRDVASRIGIIRKRHGLASDFEIKWTKVSPAKIQFYADLVDLFFDDTRLHFRALVVPNKAILRHEQFGQDHDTWYYKMYFDMLKVILSPKDRYRIYIDIKDTRSADKMAKLHDVLCNNIYDFERDVIERVQTVRSHEVTLIQLADLLVGIISYANRHLSGSSAKSALVNMMREKSQYSLTHTTLLRELKVNLFVWLGTESQ